MCASTSMIIPSRTPRCSACSRCWPIRTWCALSMARRCSPVIAAATTRVRRSRTPAMSRPWSSTNAPHAATAVPTTSQRRHRRARPCSCVPPSAVTIWEPSPPPCCGCWSATAPPSLTPLSARRSSAACLIPMRCGSHSITAASCATSRRPSPSFCPSMSRCAMLTCSHIGSNLMTNSRSKAMSNLEALQVRAKALNLHGLLAHWGEAAAAGWLATLIDWEEQERTRRSLERRLRAAQLLGELAALDSDSALRRRLRHYAGPRLLVIDEVGYLSYSNRHADLLFELVSRRYEHNSTLVTTNRPFAEWREVFPNAACVVSLVDRLVHNAEVLAIEGESYRLKEAQERAEQRARQRRKAKS